MLGGCKAAKRAYSTVRTIGALKLSESWSESKNDSQGEVAINVPLDRVFVKKKNNNKRLLRRLLCWVLLTMGKVTAGQVQNMLIGTVAQCSKGFVWQKKKTIVSIAYECKRI